MIVGILNSLSLWQRKRGSEGEKEKGRKEEEDLIMGNFEEMGFLLAFLICQGHSIVTNERTGQK